MALKIFISSLIFSFIIIVPLGVKWEIKKKKLLYRSHPLLVFWSGWLLMVL